MSDTDGRGDQIPIMFRLPQARLTELDELARSRALSRAAAIKIAIGELMVRWRLQDRRDQPDRQVER